MRRLLQIILLKPVRWLAAKFSSKPDKEKIFAALTKLHKTILDEPGKRGVLIPFEISRDKFIIFSDQHRGAKDGADDFAFAEPNYLAALDYYYKNDFHFISLGDSEELWENSLGKVKKFNEASIEKEKLFIQKSSFTKIFGNHDLYWDNDPLAWWQIKKMYGEEVKIYEGAILQPVNPIGLNFLPLSFFLTHGHQGDASSDGNWFSKFFVARIWGPLQAYLKINPNTPAYNAFKKTKHNQMMYEWSSQQKNLILITGHTHQPVFESLTHLERLYKNLQNARKEKNVDAVLEIENEINKIMQRHDSFSEDYLVMKSTYFNSGCCCYSDGDITGIEIADEKNQVDKMEFTNREEILEEANFAKLQ